MSESSPMATWSDEDKRLLLKSLYRHGPTDLEAVQAELPHKSLEDIQLICLEYSREAQRRCRLRPRASIQTNANRWQDILEKLDSIRKDVAVKDLIPRMLKYIALFEPRTTSESVDLEECYMFLSDLSFGLLPGKVTELNKAFMNKCLESLKGDTKPLREYLEALDEVPQWDNEDSIHNPLGVPESCLKLSRKERNSFLFQDE